MPGRANVSTRDRRVPTRRVLVALILPLLITIGLLPTTAAQATPMDDPTDTSAPSPFFITESTQEVPASGGAVSVSASVLDEGSGVAGPFEVWFVQGDVQTPHAQMALTSGDGQYGIWTASATIPADSVGIWKVVFGPIADVAGNTTAPASYGGDLQVRVGYPQAPATVGAAATGAGHILRISWPAGDDGGRAITGYLVLDAYDVVVASVTPDQRWADIDLGAVLASRGNGTYRVQSVNSTGLSLPSVASPRTPAPAIVPTTPTALVATAVMRTAEIRWTWPTDGFTTATLEAVATAQPGGATCRTRTNSCTIRDLTPGVLYSVTLVTVNSVGTSRPTDPVIVTPVGPPTTPPRVDARWVGDGSTARVTWQPSDPQGGGAMSYVVTTQPRTQACETTSASCTMTGLTHGVDYTFVVTPRSQLAGGGIATDPVAMAAIPAPLPPSGVTSTSLRDAVRISWTAGDPQGTPITGFTVRRIGADGSVREIELDSTTTSALIGDLAPGVRWRFELTERTATGQSISAVREVVLPDPRVKPARSTARVTNLSRTRFTVRWPKTPTTGGLPVDRYEVVVLRAGKVVQRLASSAAARAVRVRGLHAAVRYTVRVRAHNPAGWGALSSPVIRRTPRP